MSIYPTTTENGNMGDPKLQTRTCGIPEQHVAKVWNMAYYSGLVCIAPYMNVYYKRLHISERQIGVLAALSPWVNASSGAAWAAFADYTCWHKPLLILTSILALLARTSTAFVASFGMICLVALLSEGFTAPVSILSDIAIISAAKTDGHYGEQRMFASLGWGIFSALSGLLVSKFSIYTAFQLYFVLEAFAIIPVCFLRFHASPCLAQDDQSHSGAGHSQLDAVHAYQPPPMSPDPPHHLSQSPSLTTSTDTTKPSASVLFADVSSQADTSLHRSSGVLSPRASLDLSLHPDDDRVCIVKISAEAERGHYPEDSLIEDLTAVAVLEHAFQPSTTHPVFHVHMPSRPSRHHSPAASEADSGDQFGHPATTSSHQEVQGHDHHVLGSDQQQPLLHDAQHNQQSSVEDVKVWQRWKKLLGNPQAVPFFAMSLLMGFGTGILSTYLFLYLDELGGSEMLMGLCITVTCIVELPIFAANNWILKTLGVNSVIHVTLAVCVIRMAAYSTMHLWGSLWWVLAVESINGITFACFWPAGTLHCTKIAPPGMAATVQGVFTSLYGGVGGGLGGLFGGFVYSTYGAAAVFQVGLIVTSAGWMLCTVCQAIASCVCRTPTEDRLDFDA